MICPNVNSQEWQHLVTAVGEDLAYYLWDANNGNPMSMTPQGELSPLYDQMLDYTNGNAFAASKLKASAYDIAYLQSNEWRKGAEPKLEVKSNGSLYLVQDVEGVPFYYRIKAPRTTTSLNFNDAASMDAYKAPENEEDFNTKLDMMQKNFAAFDIDLQFEGVNPSIVAINGRIQLNMPYPNILAGKDSLLHEHGHILIEALGGMKDDHIAFARRQLAGTKLEEEVTKMYRSLDQESLDKEIIAQAVGMKAAELFDDLMKQRKWKAWLKVYLNRLKATLGLNHDAVMELSRKLLLDELAYTETDFQADDKVLGTPFEQRQTVEGVLENLMERVQSLYAHWQRFKNTDAIERMGQMIEDMVNFNDIRSAIVYTQNAERTTLRIEKDFEEIEAKLKAGGYITDAEFEKLSHHLKNMQQFAGAFNLIPEIQELLEAGEIEFGKKDLVELDFKAPVKTLGAVDARLKKLDRMYQRIIQEYTVQRHYKDIDIVEKNWGRKFEKEYHKLYRSADRKRLGKEEYDRRKLAFIKEKLGENQATIDAESQQYLRNMLDRHIGYVSDISSLTEWASDPKSITDSVMQIAIKIMDRIDEEVRFEFQQALREPVEAFQKFTAERGNPLNQEELYKGLYEEIDGEKTGFYNGKFLSSFLTNKNVLWNAYAEAKEVDPNGPKELEAKAAFEEWKLENEEQPYTAEFLKRVTENREQFVRTEEYVRLSKEQAKIRKRYIINGSFAYDRLTPVDKEAWDANEAALKVEREVTKAENKTVQEEFFKLWKFVETARYEKVKDEKLLEGTEAYNEWYVANHDKGKAKPAWTKLVPKSDANNNPNYREHYTTPKSQWLNPAWGNMKQMMENENSSAGQMLKFLKENANRVDKEYAGKSHRRKYLTNDAMDDLIGIPKAEKQTIERIAESGVRAVFWEGLKDKLQKRSTDTDLEMETMDNPEWEKFVKVVVDENHKVKRFIPIYFRNSLANKADQSYDLLSLEMMDLYAALNYSRKSKSEADIMIIQDAMANRKVAQQKGFKYMVNSILPWMKGENFKPVNIEGVHSNVYQALASTVENRLYNIGVQDAGSVKIFGKKISLNKLSDTIAGFTGSVMLTFNWLSAGASGLQGNILNMSEAFGGVNINAKNIKAAYALYAADFGNVLADAGRVVHRAKTNALLEYFNPSGAYQGLERRFSQNNIIRQTAGAGLHALNFTNWQEHQVQGTLMYALLDSYEVATKSGETMPLHEALVVASNGTISFNPEISLSDKEMKSLLLEAFRKIKEVTKQKHGNYDPANKAKMQRVIAGQQTSMLRKWLVPGVQHRFLNLRSFSKDFEDMDAYELSYNESSGQFQEGIYTTTLRFLRQYHKELLGLKFKVAGAAWDELTDVERGNIRQTVFEAGMMGATYLAFLAFLSLAEDDDEWAYVPAFFMRRLFGELSFYVWPPEAFKILHSPAATVSMLERLSVLAVQAIYDIGMVATGGEATRYVQKPHKGELKLWRRTKQALPIASQLERNVQKSLEYQRRMMVNQ